MSNPVIVLREEETVGRIIDILKNRKHNGFPVVEGYNPDVRFLNGLRFV